MITKQKKSIITRRKVEEEEEEEKKKKCSGRKGFVKTNGTLFSAGNSQNSAPCCYSTGMRVANHFTGPLSLEKVALCWPIAS